MNLIVAIWAWCSIWFMPTQKLERRKKFMDDILSDADKKSLPAKIWYAAYRRRGIV